MATQNEDRLELFADLMEPAAEILADPEVARMSRAKEKPVRIISRAIKKHKAEVVQILALWEGQDPETYQVPIPPVLAKKLVELLNEPYMKELFTLQGQTGDAAPSGPATEPIRDGAN